MIPGPAGVGTTTFADLGPLSIGVVVRWLVPTLVLGIPGALLVLTIAAQLLTGGGFIALGRRQLGKTARRRRS